MASKTRTRSRGTASKPKVDAYQVVTDKIVEALEQGVVPWHRPWKTYSTGPRSLSTKKPYNGANVFILGATSMLAGYGSQWWGTYKQIAEMGGQVRKGEKATPIVFWRFYGEEKDAAGKVTKKGVPVLRFYSVFNADQCDDLVVPETETLPEVEPIAECERISDGYRNAGGPELKHGGNSAHYSPALDYVQVPLIGQFAAPDDYYGVLFHEYAHSTGAEKRLNRKNSLSGVFGSPDYSREELVAEMTAAFVCGEAGIDVNVPVRAGYIESWLQAFKSDDNKKLVIEAGGAAQKAADLILGRNKAEETHSEEETA